MKIDTILYLSLASLLNAIRVTAAALQTNIQHPLTNNTVVAKSGTESKLDPSKIAVPGNATAYFIKVPRSEQIFNISSLDIEQSVCEEGVSVTVVHLRGHIPYRQLQKLEAMDTRDNPMEISWLGIKRIFRGHHLYSFESNRDFERTEYVLQGVDLTFLDHKGRNLEYLELGTKEQYIRATFFFPKGDLKKGTNKFKVWASVWEDG